MSPTISCDNDDVKTGRQSRACHPPVSTVASAHSASAVKDTTAQTAAPFLLDCLRARAMATVAPGGMIETDTVGRFDAKGLALVHQRG